MSIWTAKSMPLGPTDDCPVMGIVTHLWNTNLIINPTTLLVPRHVCFKDTNWLHQTKIKSRCCQAKRKPNWWLSQPMPKNMFLHPIFCWHFETTSQKHKTHSLEHVELCWPNSTGQKWERVCLPHKILVSSVITKQIPSGWVWTETFETCAWV